MDQAHTLSSIASSDWPDEYPDLLSSLIGLLSSGNPDSVHGAMQVFTEFIKSDLTEDQILPVLRDLLPVLLSILGAPEVCYFPVIHTQFSRAIGSRTPDARQNSVSLQTVCHRLVHGERTAPASRERSHCNDTSHLARGIQSALEH
jgi:hypothetical protein